jgi:GT2 family glycosyltransferase
MNSYPSVTVIIIIYNGVEDTVNCLKTVLQTDYPNFSLYVLDNGSTKNHILSLRQKFPDARITWERSEINLGFTGGNNKGIAHASSEYVVLLNNDTEVEKQWLRELVKVAQLDENIAICQAKLRSLTFKNYFEYAGAAGGMMDKLGYPYARGRIGFHLEEDQGQYDQITPLRWASGAAMLIKKNKLHEVGNLCEDFFLYHEETDLCWRMQNHGYKVMFAPKSVVYHKGLGSTKGSLTKPNLIKKTYYIHRNNLYMIARNMSLKRLLYVLPLRILLDYASMFFYLLTGKFEYIHAVASAQFSFFQKIPQIREFRKSQKQITYTTEKYLMPLSIFWLYFILGKKHYSEVVSGDTHSTVPLMYYDDIVQKNFVIKNRTKGFQLATSPYFFVPLLAAIMICSWYASGKLIASGEEGLAFARPFRTFEIYRYLWYDTGTGYPMPLTIPRTTFYALVSFFDIFFPSWIAQALTLYCTIVMGMTGMYFLCMNFLKNKLVAVIAALFYFFNLYSMTQVFGRQLTSGYVAWGYLPIFLGLWIKILQTKRIRWMLAVALTSSIFSNAFGHPAYVITLWIPVLLYWAYYVFINIKDRKELLDTAKTILTTVAIWALVNAWWIYPFLKLGQSSFTTADSTQGNFDSLNGVSKSFPIQEILQLKQTFLFENLFTGWYNTPQALFLTYTILGIAAIGLAVSLKRRNLRYIALLALTAVFLSKGTNQPLGYKFYHYLFTYLPQTQALRNPYEKLGILVVLAYAILFALGLYTVLKLIKKIELRILTGALVMLCTVGFLVFPIWNGTLYGANVQNVRVSVPTYYAQANTYINTQKTDGRILLLPLFYGDGVAYTWNNQEYTGIDPSEFLFDRPVVSKILRMQYFDDKFKELNDNVQAMNTKAFLQNLQELDIQYLALRNDYIIKEATPAVVKKINTDLTALPEIQKVKTFGQLDIYTYTDKKPYTHLVTEGDEPPALTYRKINPTKYTVQIKNATKPYKLILKETFNHNWKAKTANTILTDHKLEYNYANAWKITKTGTYRIDLEFSL